MNFRTSGLSVVAGEAELQDHGIDEAVAVDELLVDP
jgi:hypothetical protein